MSQPQQVLSGKIPLVEGQQSYAITYSPAFVGLPTSFDLTVAMPNDSGEVLSAVIDYSSLTVNGVTAWLSGVPSASMVGGYLLWTAYGGAQVASVAPSTGIKVVSFLNRIGRRTRGGDFTRLSMNGKIDLLEAANNALQTLYDALPVYFKEETQGFVLPAPLAVPAIGVTQYGKFVTGVTFTSAQYGQSIVIDGDPGWNQIIGTDELLNPYMGETGDHTATIYGNACYSETYPFDRVIGNPQFANQNNSPIVPYIMAQGNMGQSYWMWQQTVGLPQVWWPQVFGGSQGKRPFMVMRFAPAPSQAFAINIRLSFWPKRITLADYNSNSTLPVPDQFIEKSLIPMARRAFMVSPEWLVRGDEDVIQQQGDAGEAYARNQPGQIVAPANRVGTPRGW